MAHAIFAVHAMRPGLRAGATNAALAIGANSQTMTVDDRRGRCRFAVGDLNECMQTRA